MMKKILAGAVAAIAAGLVAMGPVPVAMADGYGAAGCGLGSMLIGNKPGFMQVLAATTNGTSASQTFGITTGTSNCADSGGGAASAQAFIQTNREAFAKDVARGNGETINGLSTLAGCRNPTAVGTALQGSFGRIFPSAKATDTQVSQSAVDALKAHPELDCKLLS
jgi:hypothetical protein